MKKNKGKRKSCLAFILAVTMLSGCGASNNYEEGVTTESATEEVYNDVEAMDMVEQEVGYGQETEEMEETDTTQESVATNRKLIKTIDLELETLHYDETLAYLEKSVKACGGYIEHSSLEGSSIYNDYSERYGNFTVRIPKDKTEEFVQGMGENTNVRRKSESTEDITLQYVDTQSHKEALKVEQERLMAILEKAETVEEIISLESRLSEVRYELNSYESRLRTYDNLVDYSTIRVEVCEVTEITEPPKLTSGERIVSGFVDSVKNICSGIKELVIALIINIPYFVVWGIVIGVIIIVIRTWRKRGKKKKTDETKTNP
ncbi:MAG: DUF4349 domain-containing protein [Lachnospiraceae bacterium]|nr:DUF4349 domain-containing protein [Lachnospiraceae bacterium]